MKPTIKPSSISIIDLWQRGYRVHQDNAQKEEQTKIGVLRGGSVGTILSDEQTVLGKCLRLAHLRFKGYSEEPGAAKSLMFDAGIKNEVKWLNTLFAAWDGKIRCEEQVPVSWTTSEGYLVSGRPDMVLFDQHDKPVLGLEHKLVSSVWTAYSVHYKFEPRATHLIQAAHYMWRLNIPFKLVYSSSVDWHIPFNLKDLAHKYDVIMRDNKPFKINPFIREYDLCLHNGTLFYYTVGMADWKETLITTEGIERYYNYVGNMSKTKQLGPRPASIDAVGSKSYNPCDYCPLTEVCDTYESDYNAWFDHACATLTTETETSLNTKE